MRGFTAIGAEGNARSNLGRSLASFSVDEGAFLVSYGAWLMAMLLNSTFFAASISNTVLVTFRYIGIAGALLSIFMRREHWASEAFGLFIVVLLVFITTRTSASFLLDLVVFVYCGRFVDFKRIARVTLWIASLLLVLTVLAAEAGIIENYVSFDLNEGVIRRREYMGFLYALQPAQLMFNITCLVVFLRGEQFTSPYAVALLLSNTLIFLKTNARLSFSISIALVFLALMLRVCIGKRTFGRFLVIAGPSAFIVCFALCWIITVDYPGQGSLLVEINHVLGNRLALGHEAIAKYGTTLFGQGIEFIGNGLDLNGKLNNSGVYNYVDCLYIRLPILYGWVFTVIFLVGMTFAAVCAARKSNYCLVLILVFIAIHCIVDDLVIRLQFCTFLFLAGSSFTAALNELLARKKADGSGCSVNKCSGEPGSDCMDDRDSGL